MRQTRSNQATIRFYVNDELHEIDCQDATRTVLQFLREDLHKTGTKEGCAEGDCGACTVMLHELDEQGKLQSNAVNACIRLLPSLNGRAIQTVEGLCQRNKAANTSTAHGQTCLHPVQQALVEHHGSQCGFCTPGFVMSLAGLWQQTTEPTREQTLTAISGNLCRCTGYRPIVDSTQSWKKLSTPAVLREQKAAEQQLQQQLKAIQPSASAYSDVPSQQWFAPNTASEISQCLQANPDAVLVAGSTDVGLWITKAYRKLPKLVFLSQVQELRVMKSNAKGLEIRAGVSLQKAWGKLVQLHPELTEVAYRFASLPVRNAGTFCGNVANGSPIGDSMPVLLALDATVVLASAQGMREIALQDLYLAYQKQSRQAGEWVYSVRIPARARGVQLRSYKVSKRSEQDISAVFAAFTLKLDAQQKVTHIRTGFGGVAAIPARAKQTEQALLGQTWNRATIERAKQVLQHEFTPLSDMRASNQYRSAVTVNLLERLFLETSSTAEAAVPVVRVAFPQWSQGVQA